MWSCRYVLVSIGDRSWVRRVSSCAVWNSIGDIWDRREGSFDIGRKEGQMEFIVYMWYYWWTCWQSFALFVIFHTVSLVKGVTFIEGYIYIGSCVELKIIFELKEKGFIFFFYFSFFFLFFNIFFYIFF